jgi:hypothetical protein
MTVELTKRPPTDDKALREAVERMTEAEVRELFRQLRLVMDNIHFKRLKEA